MDLGVTELSSRFRGDRAGRSGEDRGGLRARRSATACVIVVLSVVGARAQTAPPGMVAYDHPVYHNGVRVLWHGIGKGELAKGGASSAVAKTVAASASTAKPDAGTYAQTSKPLPTYEVTVFSDGDDACAFRLSGDIVAALKAAGLHARPTVGRTAAHFLAKLAGNDAADFVIAPVDALVEDPKSPWKDKSPYVARLAVERIEIVAGKSISAIADLSNHKVAIGLPDSADEAVATALFDRLAVKPTLVRGSLSDSLADLRQWQGRRCLRDRRERI